MGHGVGPYLSLDKIGSPSPFIIISYLFNCTFWIYPLILFRFICYDFWISPLGFSIGAYKYHLMLLFLGRLDILLKNSRTLFYLFVRFLFNFIIICSQATSIWYQSLTSIRDQVIHVYFQFLFCSLKSSAAFIHENQDPEPSFNLFCSSYCSSSTSSLNLRIQETKIAGATHQQPSPSPQDSMEIDERNPHTTTSTDHQNKSKEKKIIQKHPNPFELPFVKL